jgi:hypothetical protein
MGNHHAIIQVEPRTSYRGVAIIVSKGHMGMLLARTEELEEFRIIPIRSDGSQSFSNLDSEPRPLQNPGDYLCLTSGLKMWCGYEEYREKIRELAIFLEDAAFYIGDEEDFIDRFSIVGGRLQYARCHSGCWYDLQKYLDDHKIN